MKRTILLALLSALCLCASVRAQEEAPTLPPTFLADRVAFKAPARWVVQRHVSTKTNARAQLIIPHPSTDKTPHSANASFTANVVPDNIGVRHLSDGVYKNRYEGLSVVSDIFDGDNWRTLVWTARDRGATYVMLHRFGVVNRASVELMVAFPLRAGGDRAWVEKTVADFNEACAALRIDGQGRFDGKVKIETIDEQLKAVK